MPEPIDLTEPDGRNTIGHAYKLADAILRSQVRVHAANLIKHEMGMDIPDAKSYGSMHTPGLLGVHDNGSLTRKFGVMADMLTAEMREAIDGPSEAKIIWHQDNSPMSMGSLNITRGRADEKSFRAVVDSTEAMRQKIAVMVGEVMVPGSALDAIGPDTSLGQEKALQKQLAKGLGEIARNYQADMATHEAAGLKPMMVGISYDPPRPWGDPGPYGELIEQAGQKAEAISAKIQNGLTQPVAQPVRRSSGGLKHE